MIQDGHTGVLTGGWSGGAVTAKVTRYNRTGMQEPLPTLITARGLHGCSSLDMDGKKVRIVHGIHIVELVDGWRYFWEYLLHGSVFC